MVNKDNLRKNLDITNATKIWEGFSTVQNSQLVLSARSVGQTADINAVTIKALEDW